MLLSKLKPNPHNPRTIKDDDFYALVESLRRFPKMMELRPIVHKKYIIQAGNQRHAALEELGYTEIPNNWVKSAADFTEPELQEFIIKDNTHAGTWNWETLANEWDHQQLLAWNVVIPDFSPHGTSSGAPGAAIDPATAEIQTLTVSLAKAQAKFIKQQLAAMKGTADFADRDHHENPHVNGNALYQIVKEWQELKTAQAHQ